MKKKIDAKRIVILAVVAAVFVAVIGVQVYRYVLSPALAGEPAAAVRRTGERRQPPQSQPNRNDPHDDQNDHAMPSAASYARPAQLPKYELGEILEFDPFRVSATQPGTDAQDGESTNSAQSEASLAETILTLRQLGVTAVIEGDHGAAALIDGRTVRVGDRIGDWKVQSIDSDGIVVTPDPAE